MSRDNQTWVADLKAGSELAVSDLRDALLRNLRHALADRARIDESLLEDATQDAMLRILERLEQFQGRSRFLTWATSIAIHMVLGELRRSRWKDVSLDQLVQDAKVVPRPTVDERSSPLADLQRQSLLEALQRSIDDELTVKQRTALLAELKGMPQDEIARHMGSNRNAVYKLTHDARKKLRTALESAGYDANDLVANTAH